MVRSERAKPEPEKGNVDYLSVALLREQTGILPAPDCVHFHGDGDALADVMNNVRAQATSMNSFMFSILPDISGFDL